MFTGNVAMLSTGVETRIEQNGDLKVGVYSRDIDAGIRCSETTRVICRNLYLNRGHWRCVTAMTTWKTLPLLLPSREKERQWGELLPNHMFTARDWALNWKWLLSWLHKVKCSLWHRLNVYVLLKFYAEAQSPVWCYLEVETLEGDCYLRAFMNGISDIIKQTPDGSLASSALWGCREKSAVYNPEKGPPQSSIIPASCFQTSWSQDCEK